MQQGGQVVLRLEHVVVSLRGIGLSGLQEAYGALVASRRLVALPSRRRSTVLPSGS